MIQDLEKRRAAKREWARANKTPERSAYMREYSKEYAKRDEVKKRRPKKRQKAIIKKFNATEMPSVCEICGKPEARKRSDGSQYPLSLDHCHESGLFRGWLCNSCNAGLGLFADNPEVLIAASKYLKERGSIRPEEVSNDKVLLDEIYNTEICRYYLPSSQLKTIIP